MSAQGTYPIGARTLSGADTVTGVVTGTTADIPLSMLANYASLNSTFVYAVETQTASLGQTVFTLSSPYSNGVPGALAVYADGLRLVKDADYMETNSTTVTFTSAVAYTYEVVFVIGGEVGIAPVSIVSVVWTGGTHAPGTLDTYTITFTDSSTTTFQVYNGADWPVGGPGAFSTLSASGTVSGDGFTALFASPPPIGSTAASTGSFTTLATSGNATLGDAEATDTHAVKGATTVLANSASAALKITQTGAGNAFVVEDSASTDSTPFVIDASGNLLIGYSTQLTVTGAGSRWQGAGTGQEANVALIRYSDTAGTAPNINLARARGSVVGTNTVVQSGDVLASINFGGGDGSALLAAAQISALVDGTPGTNDMPGRLVFSTTADGASGPTERMRIDSAGLITIAAGQIKFPSTQNASADANTLDDYEEGTFTPVVKDAAAGNAATTAASVGTYTKVGRLVTANISLADINTAGMTAGNQIHITGLPFASSNTSNQVAVGTCMCSGVSSTAGTLVVYLAPNLSYITLFNEITSGISNAIVSQITSGSGDLYLTITYAA